MYRVCLTKSGKLIEMQSGGKVARKQKDDAISDGLYTAYMVSWDTLEAMRLNTLKQNALNAGYKEDEIEVKWIDENEWAGIQAELNKPTPEQIAEQKTEALIKAKIREQAIAELQKEGKL